MNNSGKAMKYDLLAKHTMRAKIKSPVSGEDFSSRKCLVSLNCGPFTPKLAALTSTPPLLKLYW